MFIRTLIVIFLLAASAFGQSAPQAPASEATHYPNLVHAELPLYPPVARTAHISGTVEIQVTIEKGAVIDAQVKSGSSPYLSNPSLANVKTWQFQPEDRASFVVKYVYRIEGDQTPLPENPKVQLDLPRLVMVTAKPFKPGCSDCGAQNHVGGPTAIDPKDGSIHVQVPVVVTAKVR